MGPKEAVRLFGGVRPVAGDAMTLIGKRLPKLPKRELAGELMAVDPLQAALAKYGDRADEALARARLFQEGEPLQFLDEGRWYGNPAAGVSGREMPLMVYPGKTIPGRPRIEGLFRSEPGPLASIQVAAGAPSPAAVMFEEAIHALDRRFGPGERAHSLKAPDGFASLLSGQSYDEARKYMQYYSLPSEIRATLSGLIADTPEFINTTDQATGVLEQARQYGTVRERATAEGLLNSKALRNEYIPYLVKALSAGGVMAGTNSLED